MFPDCIWAIIGNYLDNERLKLSSVIPHWPEKSISGMKKLTSEDWPEAFIERNMHILICLSKQFPCQEALWRACELDFPVITQKLLSKTCPRRYLTTYFITQEDYDPFYILKKMVKLKHREIIKILIADGRVSIEPSIRLICTQMFDARILTDLLKHKDSDPNKCLEMLCMNKKRTSDSFSSDIKNQMRCLDIILSDPRCTTSESKSKSKVLNHVCKTHQYEFTRRLLHEDEIKGNHNIMEDCLGVYTKRQYKYHDPCFNEYKMLSLLLNQTVLHERSSSKLLTLFKCQALVNMAFHNQNKDLKQLMKEHADADPSFNNNQALRTAIINDYNSSNTVQLLLKDPRVDPTFNSNESIKQACFRGPVGTVIHLLNNKMSDPSCDNNFCLRTACKLGRNKIVYYLLKDGRADPRVLVNDTFEFFELDRKQTQTQDCGQTLLTSAVQNGYTQIVKLLLDDSRVDPCHFNSEALRSAKSRNNKEIIYLLENDPRFV